MPVLGGVAGIVEITALQFSYRDAKREMNLAYPKMTIPVNFVNTFFQNK